MVAPIPCRVVACCHVLLAVILPACLRVLATPNIAEVDNKKRHDRFADNPSDYHYANVPMSGSKSSHGYQKDRHKYLSSGVSNGISGGKKFSNPCDMPSISDSNFYSLCPTALRKRYVCTLPPGSAPSRLDDVRVQRLERAIAGQTAFCWYDALLRRADKMPIGDALLRDDFLKSIAKSNARRELDADAGIEHKNQEDEPETVGPTLRSLDQRPALGVTIMDEFELRPLPTARHCGVRPAGGRHDDEPIDGGDQAALFQYYANVTRQRWSYGGCVADIAILVIATQDLLAYRSRRLDWPWKPVIVMSYSARGTRLLGNVTHVHNVVHKLNENNWELGAKLHRLFAVIAQLLKESDPMFDRKRVYTIPDWAWWAFGVSIVLSAASAVVGSWVNTKSRSRSSNSSTGNAPNNRKWGAGFSGGMWNT